MKTLPAFNHAARIESLTGAGLTIANIRNLNAALDSLENAASDIWEDVELKATVYQLTGSYLIVNDLMDTWPRKGVFCPFPKAEYIKIK